MKRTMLAALPMILCSAAYAQNNVPHTDGFENYPVGNLAPQGGWELWDQVPTVNGLVNTTQARNGTKSVKIVANEGGNVDTDLIHRYFNHTFDGCYTYTVYHYLPGNQTGETYFILLSDYNHGGGQNNLWAVQVRFNAAADTVIADFYGDPPIQTIEDQWVEIRVEIDFPADEHEIFYGGTSLFPAPKSWVNSSEPNNLLQVASSDWYSNNSCCQFYDDLDFQKVNCGPPQLRGCIYKAKKNSKAKGGCEACPQKNDLFSSGAQCQGPNNCDGKFKGSIPCPGGGPGSCTKVKGKRVDCIP